MPWQFTSTFCLCFMTLTLGAVVGFFYIQSINRGRRNDGIWLVEYLEQEAHERQRRYIWGSILTITVFTLLILCLVMLLNSI